MNSGLNSSSGIDGFMGLPPTSSADIQVFNDVGNWTTWKKPKTKGMTMIYCFGSGSGGGGGHTATATSARGGGGGGAGGGLARLVIPTIFLPDMLYCLPAVGGAGGAATVDGTAGGISYVSLGPGFVGTMENMVQTTQLVLQSSTAAATAGAKGTAATGGAAGAGGTLATAGLAIWGYAGLWSAVVGPAGSTGGAQTGAVGTTNAQFLATASFLPISGGAGGAGCTTTEYAGGGQTGLGPMSSLLGGALTGGQGGAGPSYMNPLMSLGGTGGGSGNSVAGGNGGSGGFASGGGGGGGGTTGGRGGDGGPGLIIIISW